MGRKKKVGLENNPSLPFMDNLEGAKSKNF